MTLILRQKTRRRFDMPVVYPLTDYQGVFVNEDRRLLADRRKDNYGLDDLKVILTKMADK